MLKVTDKYERTIAYLITDKKGNLNISLVKEGLATVSTYPPNLLFINELVTAGNKAQQDNLGILALPDYTPILVSHLPEAGHAG